MAKDELVGNMNTEFLVDYFEEKKLLNGINKNALQRASLIASEIFEN